MSLMRMDFDHKRTSKFTSPVSLGSYECGYYIRDYFDEIICAIDCKDEAKAIVEHINNNHGRIVECVDAIARALCGDQSDDATGQLERLYKQLACFLEPDNKWLLELSPKFGSPYDTD